MIITNEIFEILNKKCPKIKINSGSGIEYCGCCTEKNKCKFEKCPIVYWMNSTLKHGGDYYNIVHTTYKGERWNPKK